MKDYESEEPPKHFFRELSKDEAKTFRAWAQEHYKPFTQISNCWHPEVQAECMRINDEAKKKK